MMVAPGSIFHSILAGTGTPHVIDRPVVTAARLAGLQGARLHIVHAVPFVSVLDKKEAASSTPGPEAKMITTVSTVTTRSLFDLYADQFAELTTRDITVTTGVAWEAIIRTASDLKSDLIVVGPHVHDSSAKTIPGSKRFLGSTADGIIRQARCPVMIANADFQSDLLELKKIVVGVDFSPSCAVAVCLAALLAHHYGSFVSTFHMLPISPYPKYTPEALQAERMRLEKRMRIISRRLLDGIGHQFFLKPGARPHEELLRFASQRNADVIILGSHTKEKEGKWYSGSVVQRAASQAACPVIVVNGLEALTPWKDVPFLSGRFSMTAPHLSDFAD